MNSCMKQVLLIIFVSLVLQEGSSYGDSTVDVSSDASAKPSNSSITSTSTPTSTTTPQTATTLKNETIHGANATDKNPENGVPPGGDDGMLKRSLYVAIGLSAFVAIYFIVRWIKTKGRRKAKKYGVVHGTGEMEPLDKHMDEDEEDMTVFDVKDAKRPR